MKNGIDTGDKPAARGIIAVLVSLVWLAGAGHADAASLTPQVTWMAGPAASNSPAVYGTFQVESGPGNTPGNRHMASLVHDAFTDDLFLFGGNAVDGDHNDMWRYHRATNRWTWVSCSNATAVDGVYGTLRVAPAPGGSSLTVCPGGRKQHAAWSDPVRPHTVWLFGGKGYEEPPTPLELYLNDLWMMDTVTFAWTWMGGNNTAAVTSGSYGTLGVAGPLSWPGGRKGHAIAAALAATGRCEMVYLFGGVGYGADPLVGPGVLQDLWSFNTTSWQWTWLGGSTRAGWIAGGVNNGRYPAVSGAGSAAASNWPGAREFHTMVLDVNGRTLWLYGGTGLAENGTSVGPLGDLWSYSLVTGQWTWVAGYRTTQTATEVSVYGSGGYGVPGVAGVAGTVLGPGARYGHTMARDERTGALWVMGGFGEATQGNVSVDLSDLWQYRPLPGTGGAAAGGWTWRQGSSAGDDLPVRGTLGVPGNSGGGATSVWVGARKMAAAAWIPAASEWWVMGGDQTPSSSSVFGDLWRINTSNLTVCTPVSCAHNGTCMEHIGGGGFDCVCADGWTGPTCTFDVTRLDVCLNQPCAHGGTCVAVPYVRDSTLFFQGFEGDVTGWLVEVGSSSSGTVTRTLSTAGPLHVPAYDGVAYGTLTSAPDAYAPGLGGAGYTFFNNTQGGQVPMPYPGSAFVQSVAVYLDVQTAAPSHPTAPAFELHGAPSSCNPADLPAGGIGWGGEHVFQVRYNGTLVTVTLGAYGASPVSLVLAQSGWYVFAFLYFRGPFPSSMSMVTLTVSNGTSGLLPPPVLASTTQPNNQSGEALPSQWLAGPSYLWITAFQNGFSNETLAVDDVQAYNTTSVARCVCAIGYTGDMCQTDIDECALQPCANGATCIDQVGGFQCRCAAGYQGPTCETDINECSSQPCVNGGTCFDAVDGYRCACPFEFLGPTCQWASCRATSADDCAPGYQLCSSGTLRACAPIGSQCMAMPAVDSPCANAAAPYNTACFRTGREGLTGLCVNLDQDNQNCGACGLACDETLAQVCCHGACRDVTRYGPCVYPGDPAVPHQTCQCDRSIAQAGCNMTTPACASQPCSYGGSCSDAANGTFVCACPPGTSGLACETNLDECASQPCANGATCVDQLNGYQCVCPAGFVGARCQTNVNDCAQWIPAMTVFPVPCMTAADCPASGGGNSSAAPYACSIGGRCVTSPTQSCGPWPCPAGSVCDTASHVCGPSQTTAAHWTAGGQCANGGTCVDGLATFACLCPPGYSGAQCQTDVDECASAPCASGATCVDGVNGFHCVCAAGYSGPRCATNIDECASSPCASGGTCQDLVNGYHCVCVPGYEGVRCQTETNECASSPCANGALCVDGLNGFQCTCLSGFTGPTCATDTDECASSPCTNGATCVDQVAGFRCLCPCAFQGTRCETTVVDACTSSPCAHGSTCHQQTSGACSFDCVCATGFFGRDCSQDACSSAPCQMGATCVVVAASGGNSTGDTAAGGFVCQCPTAPFVATGATCAGATPYRAPNSTAAIVYVNQTCPATVNETLVYVNQTTTLVNTTTVYVNQSCPVATNLTTIVYVNQTTVLLNETVVYVNRTCPPALNQTVVYINQTTVLVNETVVYVNRTCPTPPVVPPIACNVTAVACNVTAVACNQTCPPGFVDTRSGLPPVNGTGVRQQTCQDINECAIANGGCDNVTSNCVNVPGTFLCVPVCAPNVTLFLCTPNNGGCSPLRTCSEVGGATLPVRCGPCPAGYHTNGTMGCADVNECAANNGGCSGLTRCINTPGSRLCTTCPSGYLPSPSGGQCFDINECATDNGGCDARVRCTNTPGGRTCASCPTGCIGSGDTACVDSNNPCDAQPCAVVNQGGTAYGPSPTPLCTADNMPLGQYRCVSAAYCSSASHPCQNGGVCDSGTQRCRCPAATLGYHCELARTTVDCRAVGCANNGTCLVAPTNGSSSSSLPSDSSASCQCTDEYTGPLCQQAAALGSTGAGGNATVSGTSTNGGGAGSNNGLGSAVGILALVAAAVGGGVVGGAAMRRGTGGAGAADGAGRNPADDKDPGHASPGGDPTASALDESGGGGLDEKRPDPALPATAPPPRRAPRDYRRAAPGAAARPPPVIAVPGRSRPRERAVVGQRGPTVAAAGAPSTRGRGGRAITSGRASVPAVTSNAAPAPTRPPHPAAGSSGGRRASLVASAHPIVARPLSRTRLAAGAPSVVRAPVRASSFVPAVGNASSGGGGGVTNRATALSSIAIEMPRYNDSRAEDPPSAESDDVSSESENEMVHRSKAVSSTPASQLPPPPPSSVATVVIGSPPPAPPPPPPPPPPVSVVAAPSAAPTPSASLSPADATAQPTRKSLTSVFSFAAAPSLNKPPSVVPPPTSRAAETSNPSPVPHPQPSSFPSPPPTVPLPALAQSIVTAPVRPSVPTPRAADSFAKTERRGSLGTGMGFMARRASVDSTSFPPVRLDMALVTAPARAPSFASTPRGSAVAPGSSPAPGSAAIPASHPVRRSSPSKRVAPLVLPAGVVGVSAVRPRSLSTSTPERRRSLSGAESVSPSPPLLLRPNSSSLVPAMSTGLVPSPGSVAGGSPQYQSHTPPALHLTSSNLRTATRTPSPVTARPAHALSLSATPQPPLTTTSSSSTSRPAGGGSTRGLSPSSSARFTSASFAAPATAVPTPTLPGSLVARRAVTTVPPPPSNNITVGGGTTNAGATAAPALISGKFVEQPKAMSTASLGAAPATTPSGSVRVSTTPSTGAQPRGKSPVSSASFRVSSASSAAVGTGSGAKALPSQSHSTVSKPSPSAHAFHPGSLPTRRSPSAPARAPRAP